MAEITNSVGSAPSANLPHDVALIQAILKVTLSPKGRSYFPEKYNGRCGKSTISAIEAFQADHATAAPSFSGLSMRSRARLYTLQQPMLSGFTGAPRLVRPLYDRPASVSGARYQVSARTLTLQDELGAIRPGWPTMRALSDLLPPDYKGMRTAEGSHLVYWAGSAKAAADSATAIASDTRLNQPFREKVADLVQKMFDSYEIVLAPASGSNPLRTFQDQYKIRSEHPERTQAGPGESNHNYGQAIDIGFVGLKWMKPTGAIVTEGSSVLDLAQLSHVSDAWRKELWRLRGDIESVGIVMRP